MGALRYGRGTGTTGLSQDAPDTRFGANTFNLSNGPYQISRLGPNYDQYAASPVHRFYQNWQQADCNIKTREPRQPERLQDGSRRVGRNVGRRRLERHAATA
jgi:hypothetical protein